ncbi:MAG: hypothetical protein WCR67_00805 [Bacilli bacterium]
MDEKDIQNIVAKEKATEVYKWLKICQAVILFALGVIFVVCSYNSDGMIDGALSICLGIVFALYGLMELFAGYYLYRNFISQDVLFGALAIAFSVVLFSQREILESIFSIFIISVIFIYAALLIVFGVDRCVGKSGVKKNITFGVLGFIAAAVLIGCGVAYIVLRNLQNSQVDKWMTVIIGALMAVLGVVSFVTLMIKINNTKKMMRVREAEEKNNEARKTEDATREVKVVNFDDLKKESRKHGKKILNGQKVNKSNTQTLVISEDSEGNVEYRPKAISDSEKSDDDSSENK